MIAPDLDAELPDALDRVHFVGIGGSGMSGIAELFLAAGHRVTGSDLRDSATVTRLRQLGASVAVGHDGANLPSDADAVIVTGALWQDNPEYQAALARGVPVLHRANALHWLSRGHRLVAVAGAHGKSTSTGMLVTALRGLGADPSFVNGGVIAGYGTSSGFGRGTGTDALWVVEADESDGSFLLYDTAVALVTNVDADHLDHYGSHAAFDDAFVRFASAAREFVAISADDPGAQRVAARLDTAKLVRFGWDSAAEVRLCAVSEQGPVALELEVRGQRSRAQLRVPGAHNAVNAAGVVAVLVGLGFDPAASLAAIEAFAGTGRRFESHGEVGGVRLFDDYAHHPTEVAAALQTARSVAGSGRVIAVHQPHLYSRTQLMAAEFAEAYERGADHTVVLDVFGAREDPVPGVTGALVAERFRDQGAVDFRPDWADAASRVAEIARPGDLVMTLSCGDVYRIIPQLAAAIEARAAGAETGR